MIVSATPEIIDKFYGERPYKTMKAIACVEDGEVLAVGGYCVLPHGIAVFSEIKPEAMSKKKMIVKGTRMIMEMAKKAKLPIYAIAQPEIEGSCRLLEKLGFVEKEGIYRWEA